MTISVDHLPFDILFFVASYLDLEDNVSLSQTCRHLKGVLQEKTLCRRIVEV